jgi:hypothetical protein
VTSKEFPRPRKGYFRAWFRDARHEKVVIDNFDSIMMMRLARIPTAAFLANQTLQQAAAIDRRRDECARGCYLISRYIG